MRKVSGEPERLLKPMVQLAAPRLVPTARSRATPLRAVRLPATKRPDEGDSMPTQRAILISACAAITIIAAPAAAQVPDNVLINIMRECAKIDDPTARLACYDNNIRSVG